MGEKCPTFHQKSFLQLGEIYLLQKANNTDVYGRKISLDKYLQGKIFPGETSNGVIMSLEKFAMG